MVVVYRHTRKERKKKHCVCRVHYAAMSISVRFINIKPTIELQGRWEFIFKICVGSRVHLFLLLLF